MAAWRTWPWRLVAMVGSSRAIGQPRPFPVDAVVVLERPWWARVLGTGGFAPAGALGPVLVVGGGVAFIAGAGADAAAVVGVGLLLCEVLRRSWRVGLRVDAEGWHVQNLWVHHDVPWSDATTLWLAGRARSRPGEAILDRRGARSVSLIALAGIGRRRRVEWLAAVASLALGQGVDVVDSATYAGYWRGARHLPVAAGVPGRFRVQGVLPPPPQARRVVIALVGIAAVAAIVAAVVAATGGRPDAPVRWAVGLGLLAGLIGGESAATRRRAHRDGNTVRPPRGR